jgi:hypothetical protein
MKCDKCGNEIEDVCYRLEVRSKVAFNEKHYCCRSHLIQHIAPELKQAVVIEQWVPTTQEEVDRMGQ